MIACRVCASPLLRDADSAFQRGATAASVSRMLGVSVDSAKRHRRAGHVPPGPSPVVQAPALAGRPSSVVTGAPTPATSLSVPAPSGTPEEQADAAIAQLEAMLAGNLSTSQRLGALEALGRAISRRAAIVGPTPNAKLQFSDIEGGAELMDDLMRVLEPFVEARMAMAAVLRERLGIPSVVFDEPSEIVEDRLMER